MHIACRLLQRTFDSYLKIIGGALFPDLFPIYLRQGLTHTNPDISSVFAMTSQPNENYHHLSQKKHPHVQKISTIHKSCHQAEYWPDAYNNIRI
jgi:hypothetical protein